MDNDKLSKQMTREHISNVLLLDLCTIMLGISIAIWCGKITQQLDRIEQKIDAQGRR